MISFFPGLGLRVMLTANISSIDAIANRKIYETYMHFGRISYIGKSILKGVKKQIFSTGPTGWRTDLPLKLAIKYHSACFS